MLHGGLKYVLVKFVHDSPKSSFPNYNIIIQSVFWAKSRCYTICGASLRSCPIGNGLGREEVEGVGVDGTSLEVLNHLGSSRGGVASPKSIRRRWTSMGQDSMLMRFPMVVEGMLSSDSDQYWVKILPLNYYYYFLVWCFPAWSRLDRRSDFWRGSLRERMGG